MEEHSPTVADLKEEIRQLTTTLGYWRNEADVTIRQVIRLINEKMDLQEQWSRERGLREELIKSLRSLLYLTRPAGQPEERSLLEEARRKSAEVLRRMEQEEVFR